ncbi:ankyrin [Artomyces pyxidatus]|uniref:Ankyrin n=1 Tax=Artomyces pyxidatus TaxID=48021 RepID=A0ACB8SPR2_9AGAM|nr:ankyrin [Artomyces pyxidatus]
MLSTGRGGQELRDLYQRQSLDFHFPLLNDFAALCYIGSLTEIIEAVQSGTAPPLDGTETPFKFGYATLVVAGSQRLKEAPAGHGMHAATLAFLLRNGCPPDVEDICRYTALQHCAMVKEGQPELLRLLLDKGAQVDHQDIYGMTAVTAAIMAGHTGAVDVLMEHGASITIPDADGTKAESIFLTAGPQVTAIVTKWLRHRTGEQAPMSDKACAGCGKAASVETKLKHCSACHSVLYCSAPCQKSHWKTHKLSCKPFTPTNVVTLKPVYMDSGELIPLATMTRNLTGYPTQRPSAREQRMAQQVGSYPKNVIVKIQVPWERSLDAAALNALQGPLLVYTKKRDFVCQIFREHAPAAYDRVCRVVRSKCVGGAKGYFAAELKSAEELVVKVGEILAEQPF